MDEGEALLDLLLVDLIAVGAVVSIYLLVVKVRSLFKGFRGLRTEHYVRSNLGMPRLANFVRRRSGRPLGSKGSNSSPVFWIRYWGRKGTAKTLHRFSLERRLAKKLKECPKQELDKIAFSLMFWRRQDCPNEDLYIARPPHHISLQDGQWLGDERAAAERRQRLLAIKAKSDKDVLQWITNDIRRRSSSSLQWIYDSLDKGWVAELGTTKSKAIRFTQENELGSSSG